MSLFRLFGPPNVEKLKAKSDIQGLIGALSYEKDTSVQIAAAEALGQFGRTQALEPLTATWLKNITDSDIRKATVKALNKIDPNWRELESTKSIIWNVVEPLIATLKEHEKYYSIAWINKWQSAAQALGLIGDKRAVEELVAASLVDFNNNDWTEKNRATMVQTLNEINDPRAIELLIENLKSEERDYRWGAAIILGDIGDARAVMPLVEVLKDKSESVQREAAIALGKIGDPRAIAPLNEITYGQIRIAAEYALILLNETDSVDVWQIISMLNSNSESARNAATRALGKLRGSGSSGKLLNTALHDLINADRRIGAQDALVVIGDTKIVKRLIENLKQEKTFSETLEGAKRVLGQMLKRIAADIASDDLREIATLTDGTRLVHESRFNPMTDGYEDFFEPATVDHSQLRQLAQQELARRGL